MNQSKEPSGADKGAGGFRSADFSGDEPRRIGLGHPLGCDPSRKSDVVSLHNNASAVASSNTDSSTSCALRSAASRGAVIASLFTLRGIPLVA